MTHLNDDTPDAMRTAAGEGTAAQRIGVPVEHNPYESGTDEYDAWDRAWENAACTIRP